MLDYRFEPAQLRVAAGQPLAVRLSNDGARPHSIAVPALDIDVLVPSGRTRTVVVRLPAGTYDVTCSVGDHEQQGMRGRIVVLGPDAAVSTGLTAGADTMHDHHAANGGTGG
jgi:plastocyanin